MTEMTLNRRDFLVSVSTVAGGMALGLAPAGAADPDTTGSVPWGPETPTPNELSAWIVIAPDDTVTFRIPTPEIGNGTVTQVAMNITEELNCDWSKVKVEYCSITRDYREKGVYNTGFLPFFGGHGTREDRLARTLQLGASARERLKAAAAARWKVPVADIEAKDSVLTHKSSGRTLRYGDVAADAAKVKLAQEPAPKPHDEWTFIGKKSPVRLHVPGVAAGTAVFGIDVKLPGMVHAALLQSPTHGGKLKSHKPEAVLKMPGVRAVVVLDPSKTKGSPVKPDTMFGIDDSYTQSGVAVIADHYWQAKRALDALPVEWDQGPGGEWTDENKIYNAARVLHTQPAEKVLHKAGDVTAVKSGKTVEAEYATPYCENAMMEPLNGTALYTADGVEVWCPTQDIRQAFWIAADETGYMPEKVKIHPTLVGGGFGRRGNSDDVRMVVAVAREYPGVPVKTIWSREETFRQGRFRTPVIGRYKAVLDDSGYPSALTARAVFVGTKPLYHGTQNFGDVPYFLTGVIPNVELSTSHLPMTVLNGAYRGPGYNSHAFMVETFIDECAAAAGIDPLAYRLKLVSKWDKSWTDCLKVAAEKSGWGTSLPKGEGRGIAIASWPMASLHNFGTIIAAVAHVAVSKAGALTVKQLDYTFDCGSIANADAVHAMIEGGAIFGMNMSLNEELTVKNGAINEGNFDSYRMLRIGDKLPKVNVHFDALSGHGRLDIVGEAPVGPVGPAIANAIFQATGKRLRTMPFRKHDLRWA